MSNYIDSGTGSFDQTSPHTIVVLGPPRSGTSMISGILRLLGIYMGECNISNNEDPRFNKTQGAKSIRSLIAANNATHPVWGWKEPSTHIYYENVADLVRNPFFIVVCRNILGSASSKLKHTGDGDIARLVGGYAGHYLKISKPVNHSNAPCIYINYDKALSDPVALADHLSRRFMDQPLDANKHDRIARYCVPGNYKSIDDFI